MIRIHIDNLLNESLQVGDHLFTIPINSHIAYDFSQSVGTADTLVELGPVAAIGSGYVEVDTTTPPNVGDFITFLKNNTVNKSGIKGYYASISLKHTGVNTAELFALSSEVVESSK